MKDLQERLLSKVEKADNGCWVWKAYTSPRGYGQYRWKDRTAKAHRFAYEAFKGPIPEGMEIDHLCRVRNCINPDHLEAVSKLENIMRGESFGAKNARKTHCAKGHAYDEANTGYAKTNGQRYCRACHLIRSRKITVRDNLRRRERWAKDGVPCNPKDDCMLDIAKIGGSDV